MKTNRLIITAILIITGSFLVNLSAQEALKAVVKKCENAEGVDVSIISQKAKEKKETNTMTSVSFKNNEGLKKEILDAFEKDRDQADRTMINKSNGKVYTLNYSFGKTSYMYSEGTEGKVSFSVRETFQYQ